MSDILQYQQLINFSGCVITKNTCYRSDTPVYIRLFAYCNKLILVKYILVNCRISLPFPCPELWLPMSLVYIIQCKSMTISTFRSEIKPEVEECNAYIITNISNESGFLTLIYYETVSFVLNLLQFLIDIKFCFYYREMIVFIFYFSLLQGGCKQHGEIPVYSWC